MTQPKKPEKATISKTSPDYDGREYASERWNDAIEEMDAYYQYYQPIVEDLFDALDYLQRMSIIAYSRIDGGTYDLAQAIDRAKEALAKYKAIK
jgi:hypothetical protein